MKYCNNYERKNNINEKMNESVMKEDSTRKEEPRYMDYWEGRTNNEFIRYLGSISDPKYIPERASLLIPKWPLVHPNKYNKYWQGTREEIMQEEDGYYEIFLFRQLTQAEGNDKFNIILLDGEDILIPIRLYSRGGVEVDPKYRTEFNRRFSNEERHFILGCILYNEQYLHLDANSDYRNGDINYIQHYAFSRYRDNMSPKRLRTGDIRLYDSKARRKIKVNESSGIYTQMAINLNINSNTFEHNLNAQYQNIINEYK